MTFAQLTPSAFVRAFACVVVRNCFCCTCTESGDKVALLILVTYPTWCCVGHNCKEMHTSNQQLQAQQNPAGKLLARNSKSTHTVAHMAVKVPAGTFFTASVACPAFSFTAWVTLDAAEAPPPPACCKNTK
jgi:hypothetical protein